VKKKKTPCEAKIDNSEALKIKSKRSYRVCLNY